MRWIKTLTPPVSTRVTKTNMSWYLYTQELIHMTMAAAMQTRGARGAKTSPTVPINSWPIGLGYDVGYGR